MRKSGRYVCALAGQRGQADVRSDADRSVAPSSWLSEYKRKEVARTVPVTGTQLNQAIPKRDASTRSLRWRGPTQGCSEPMTSAWCGGSAT